MARRSRRDDLLSPEAMAGAGAALEGGIPYDRTGLSEDPAMAAATGAADAPVIDPTTPELPDAGTGMPDASAGILGDVGLGAGGGAPVETSQLTDADLAALVGDTGAAAPESAVGGDVGLEGPAALEDPNVPPEVKAMLQEQLARAGRRRLGGM